MTYVYFLIGYLAIGWGLVEIALLAHRMRKEPYARKGTIVAAMILWPLLLYFIFTAKRKKDDVDQSR